MYSQYFQVGDYSTLLDKGEAFAEFLRTYAEKAEEETVEDGATSTVLFNFVSIIIVCAF